MRALALLLLAATTPALALSTPKVERTGPAELTISWADAAAVDVLESQSPDASPRQARLISAADDDGRHSVEDSGTTRRYFLLRDRRTGQTVRVAERLLPLEAGSNFRDIGGYPAAGGKHVRWGLIYRSGGQPRLTDTDLARIRALGLANLVDLRSAEERRLAPTRIQGVPYTAVGYSLMALLPAGQPAAVQNGSALYRGLPLLMAPHLRIVFDRLLETRSPLAYNCSAGQDRTGFVSAMILSALGVPREVIIEDYLASTALRRPENEMLRLDPATIGNDPVAGFFAAMQSRPEAMAATPLMEADGTPFLEGAFAEIASRYGSVEAYLEKEAGLTPARRRQLRALYLE
jgi:protein-tyrosine phosphatase